MASEGSREVVWGGERVATYLTPFIAFFPYCGAWFQATQFGATRNVLLGKPRDAIKFRFGNEYCISQVEIKQKAFYRLISFG